MRPKQGLKKRRTGSSGGATNPIDLTQLNATSKGVYIRQSTSIVPTNTSDTYYDPDYTSSNFATVNFYTTNQSSNPIPYKWVKISLKTKRVSGSGSGQHGADDEPGCACLLRWGRNICTTL